MLGIIAAAICMIFVLWLFIRDQELRPMTSNGLWLVLAWMWVIGSRHVSSWLDAGTGTSPDIAVAFMDGTPIDRNIYLALIVAATLLLWKRKPDWQKIINANLWFVLFWIYCGISVAWSDFPMVSLKRLIKEGGNILMVLIVVTERNPALATRALLARYSYLAIPLSVLLITCFAQVGIYERDGIMFYGGVTTEKNELGLLAFICGLFLVWDLLQTPKERGAADQLSQGVLLLMALWLIYMAGSSTALVCLMLGSCLLILIRYSYLKGLLKYLGCYTLGLASIVLLVVALPSLLDSLTELLGRDRTLTGRTVIWQVLLQEPLNPLIGTGFKSFWLGPRLDYYFDQFAFHLTEAHNGYLETYLNGGLIGLGLLSATLFCTARKLRTEALQGNSFALLLLSFLFAALFYNCTEAMFSKHNILWVLLLIGTLHHAPGKPA